MCIHSERMVRAVANKTANTSSNIKKQLMSNPLRVMITSSQKYQWSSSVNTSSPALDRPRSAKSRASDLCAFPERLRSLFLRDCVLFS